MDPQQNSKRVVNKNQDTPGSRESQEILGKRVSPKRSHISLGRRGSNDIRIPSQEFQERFGTKRQDRTGSHAATNWNGSQASLKNSGSHELRGYAATNVCQNRNNASQERIRAKAATNGSQDSRLKISWSQDFEGMGRYAATNRNGSQDEVESSGVTNGNGGHERERNGSQDDQEKGSSPEFLISFYGHFAEKAVSNLKDAKERVLAARWILFLKRQTISSVRAEHLKQLLFVCFHGSLAGVFAKSPQEPLEPLPQHHTTEWLARQMSLARQKEQIEVLQEASEARTEYLAVQSIPYFGTQCFFAISDDPIENWENAPKEADYLNALSA